MNLLEHQGKRLLADTGIAAPRGTVVTAPEGARSAAAAIGGRVVLKSQIPSGKRGKQGGIVFADSAETAEREAGKLLGSELAGYTVREVLVESGVDIRDELYAAILNDPGSKGPLILFSTAGGMDIEEVNATAPERVRSLAVDVRSGLTADGARQLLEGSELPDSVANQVVDTLLALYRIYSTVDATLVEVNPLAVTADDRVLALDSKISLDPGALPRHAELIGDLAGSPEPTGTELEREGNRLGLQFLELDGNVGVLANGAGLTMTTLDAVTHYGGRPANFLEIGGDAYTKATPALRLVLGNPNVRSLLVNFCGAFARTDVMAEGVVTALEELRPEIPVFFTIHGTGEEEAIALVRQRLNTEVYDLMDDAVRAAVAAAREGVR